MFIWAFIICSISILISTQISYQIQVAGASVNLTGIFAVLFTVIPSVYFLTLLIKNEERIEEEEALRMHEIPFLERHTKDLSVLLFYFGGLTMAFALWSFFLPPAFFQVQITKINQIQGISAGSADVQFENFKAILFNNLQVMFFSFLFSFIFGAGAVFIITWNASILGVYIGQLSRSLFEIPVVTLMFIPHGVPEILAYLAAGISGGIMSAALLRKNKMEVLELIIFDCFKLLFLAVFLVFIAAGIEVYL